MTMQEEFKQWMDETDPYQDWSFLEEQAAWITWQKLYDRITRLEMYIDRLTEGTD